MGVHGADSHADADSGEVLVSAPATRIGAPHTTPGPSPPAVGRATPPPPPPTANMVRIDERHEEMR